MLCSAGGEQADPAPMPLAHADMRPHVWFWLLVLALPLTLAALSVPATRTADAAFPGANGKIAFTRGVDAAYGDEIFVMNPDGSGQTRLTSQEGADWLPSWSPDGSKIAFASARDGVENHEIYVMDADGSGQTRLTTSPGYDYAPSWSPDGQMIAFNSTRDHAGNAYSDIYVMNADGSGQARLTFSETHDGSPKWSPDGTKIGFGTDRDGNQEIYSMDPDGSNQQNLTNHPHDDSCMSWSPDGTKIAFTSTRASITPSGGVDNYDIFVMNADGSSPVNLTNSTQATPLHGYEFCPAWSPDGTRIVFHAAGANTEPDPAFVNPIFSMNANGSGVTQLTAGVSQDQYTDWQPLAAISPPPPVGGVGYFTDLEEPSRSGSAPMAVLAAVAAGVFVLTTVFWYGTRRRAC